MEVGAYFYGFCGRIAEVLAEPQCYLEDCRSTHQISAIHSLQYDVYSRENEPDLYSTDHTVTRSASYYRIGS